MKYFRFDDDIDTETVSTLVDKLQGVDGKINLWFSTNGGEITAMLFLIDFLNSRKKDIEIVLSCRLISAGTIILTNFKGKIILDEQLDFILFHCNDRQSYSIRDNNDPVCNKILTSQDIERNIIFIKKIKNKGLLTDKQLKQFSKGKDVVVYREQFKTWDIWKK